MTRNVLRFGSNFTGTSLFLNKVIVQEIVFTRKTSLNAIIAIDQSAKAALTNSITQAGFSNQRTNNTGSSTVFSSLVGTSSSQSSSWASIGLILTAAGINSSTQQSIAVLNAIRAIVGYSAVTQLAAANANITSSIAGVSTTSNSAKGFTTLLSNVSGYSGAYTSALASSKILSNASGVSKASALAKGTTSLVSGLTGYSGMYSSASASSKILSSVSGVSLAVQSAIYFASGLLVPIFGYSLARADAVLNLIKGVYSQGISAQVQRNTGAINTQLAMTGLAVSNHQAKGFSNSVIPAAGSSVSFSLNKGAVDIRLTGFGGQASQVALALASLRLILPIKINYNKVMTVEFQSRRMKVECGCQVAKLEFSSRVMNAMEYDMTKVKVFPASAGGIDTFSIDWTDYLEEGETIQGANWLVPTDLLQVSTGIEGNFTKITLDASAINAAELREVYCTITTQTRQEPRYFRIHYQNRSIS